MKLGLGTVQLGIDYGVANKTGCPDMERAVEILDTAWRGGITAYDTAAAYGNSEKIIGRFVSTNGLEGKIKIVTKAGEVDYNSIYRNIESALDNINVPYIDYFLLHRSQELDDTIVPAVAKLKSDGLIRKFGVSVYNSDEIFRCLDSRYGDVMDIVQIPFNILDRRLVLSGAIREMRSRQIEIHARSIYLQGLITMDTVSLPESLRGAAGILCRLDSLAESVGLNRNELAHCYVRDSEIDLMFVGCETVEQVRSNLLMHSLPPVDIERILDATRVFENIPESILNPALWG